MTLQEQRDDQIKYLEELGDLSPKCLSCQDLYAFYRKQWQPGMSAPMAPRHRASALCESGKRPHCTCNTCF